MHLYTDFMTIGATVGGLRIGDMAVQLFFFLLLLFLLKKFAWGPVMNVMEKRENYVAGEIESAEKSRAEAEIAAKEASDQLHQTKQEAQKMIEDAKNAGVKQEQDIVESARLEAERIKQAAQDDIQNEKEQALQALQDKVSSLSVLIASKVIEKEISEQDQEALINEYIKEIGEER
ncbi:F-type H+-transporting ATPase subunit b [Virgibacillus natechei]|uniref:ATP synthase subunit b n=2 Tax=Virgibacillus natechei TaxID=1216297 RepID=A0ABS4IH17_9BACI|nr:F0F1 ATP synthase subunit B [Virgibacillus natechei]MBP1969875.1 F-type H+-transporting ATPase subunit b [Virgibacillus natechei]UZD12598.1 F0F1 ATP synthase subunit B [Virgibacillus natechei]